MPRPSVIERTRERRVRVRTWPTRVAEIHAALASAQSPTRGSRPSPSRRRERCALGSAVRAVPGRRRGRSSKSAGSAAFPGSTSDRPAHSARAQCGTTAKRCALRRTGGFRCNKTRVHGDLHLGQVLTTGDGFVLIDFEGEPAALSPSARPSDPRWSTWRGCSGRCTTRRSLPCATHAPAHTRCAPLPRAGIEKPARVPSRVLRCSGHRSVLPEERRRPRDSPLVLSAREVRLRAPLRAKQSAGLGGHPARGSREPP